MKADLLEMRGITKDFPGVRALNDVSFAARNGEIHALIGENGAGKSTLMKVLSGVYPNGTYSGQILMNKSELKFQTIREAQNAGIILIPQELNLCPHISVAENMFLSTLPARAGMVRWSKANQEAQRMIDDFDIGALPTTTVAHLRAGQQQLVLLARALLQHPRVLILDEPTSSLTSAEADLLFTHLRKLKSQGIISIYISHRLDEVGEIADHITVMRDGRIVGGDRKGKYTRHDIVKMMVGREITEMYPRIPKQAGSIAMEVRDMTLRDPLAADKVVVDHVSLQLRNGEITGLYGLMGAGRTELAMALFGAWAGKKTGEIEIQGSKVALDTPREAMKHGVGLLTEDRKQLGLFLDKSVMMNISIANLISVSTRGVINEERESTCARTRVRQLSIKTPSLNTIVDNLSGGNQQKVIVARWLAAESKILLLDEPTKGIDVGAKREMFDLLNRLALDGNAVLFISSELPEILGISDRILVMAQGQLVADLDWQDATAETVMHFATGGS